MSAHDRVAEGLRAWQAARDAGDAPGEIAALREVRRALHTSRFWASTPAFHLACSRRVRALAAMIAAARSGAAPEAP